MKKLIIALIASCLTFSSWSQHTLKLSVKNKEERSPLQGATVTIPQLNRTVQADSLGIAFINNIPAGTYLLKISFTDMEEQEIRITVPLPDNDPIEIFMEEGEEEEEVIISATRTSRSIKDIPTRVETISGEELAEKGNMKPGDIRMMLNESTGIQTQQTSPTSYNSAIRIQGLDGRYTQILKDGFPLYAGFAGGLSLMQIAPLDLKQVEVIKGSSSTLYGGGAIAGLVNLVSKVPTEEKELKFLANFTSALGTDLSGFYSQKFKKTGLSFFASHNTGAPYDPANIGLTAIPKFDRYTVNPRLFFYGKKTSANIGFSYINENRTGGDINYIKRGTPGYFESNKTDRFTTQVDALHTLTANSSLQFKSSFSVFNRLIRIPSFAFGGSQHSSYSELNFTHKKDKMHWIAGANFLTDQFREEKHNTTALRSYSNNTFGLFLQNTFTPASHFSLETGLRADHVNEKGFVLLPRLSAMWKASQKFTVRLGGGLGYKIPTVFTEDAERIQFQRILPIDQENALIERSAGANLDFNFRAKLGEVNLSVNQLFFYTRINKPLVLTPVANNELEFINADGFIDTKGIETNLRFSYDHFKLFIGYTYADVNTHFNNTKAWFPLTARHRLNNVLMYEIEDKLKIGLEAYYYGPQKLNDGKTGRAYWISGLMAEKLWERFSVFINFENIFDTRQTSFDTIYTGSISNPVFRDIYAPVDGFVINGGFKISLMK